MDSSSLLIREYRDSDFDEVLSLFRRTIVSSCSKDYSKEEIVAWQNVEEEKFSNKLKNSDSIVCIDGTTMVVFCMMDKNKRK